MNIDDSVTDTKFGFTMVENKSKLVINENFEIYFIRNKPNVWFRFWYRVLLGWEWFDV